MAVRAITHRTETYTVTLAMRCADKGHEREDELHHREERRAEQREKWEGTACGVCVGRHPTVGGQSGTRSWRAFFRCVKMSLKASCSCLGGAACPRRAVSAAMAAAAAARTS